MRIVLTTVGTTGDVRPFLSLAIRLQQEGHVVRVCSHGIMARWFESHGVDFVPVGPPIGWDDIRETGRRVMMAGSPQGQLAVLQEHHLREPRRHYDEVHGAMRGFDLAVCHTIHHLAHAAAETLGLRWAGVRLDPALIPTRDAPPTPFPSLGRVGNGLLWRLFDRFFASADRTLRRCLVELGVPNPNAQMFRGTSPWLNLVACSRHLIDAFPEPRTTPFRVTGDWSLMEQTSPLPSDLEHFLTSGPKPVVCTLGSMTQTDPAATSARLRDAVRRLGLRAVIQRGVAGLEGPVTRDVLYVDTVPHDALFPRASAVVHHGGAGTTHAACRAGVPSVVIPHVGDQYFWGRRLHQLGVAPRPVLQRRFTVETLTQAISVAIREGGGLARAARALGQRLGQEDGASTAAALLTSLASHVDTAPQPAFLD